MTASLTPPFTQDNQLVPDQDATGIGVYKTNVEHKSLPESVYDDELHSMHKWLWYAGRKGNISPLHHQKVIHRDIILTERARLHLVWYGKTLYVRRLGNEFLNWNYFSEVFCRDERNYHMATGFLLSYARLIEYASDLNIAQNAMLVNKCVTWHDWQQFRNDVLFRLAGRNVHDRYEYGELRLSRLNQIYRMKGLGLTYFNVYRDYSSYFGENYTALFALFALVSVALSAMQVMTNMNSIPIAAMITLYRFAIATLAALSKSCTALLSLYVRLYVWNWCLILVRCDYWKR